ncbi:MAG: twin-arginine translocase TatA/TatE family subunit [Campylobacterales bacterium]
MGVSMTQVLVVLLIVILLFGAKKIPELMKGLGSGIKTFKKEMNEDEEVEASKTKEKLETKDEKKQEEPTTTAQTETSK